ncbi:uncharacterized protein LOC126965014 [Leptidea sinapis]|uniref:uncharacterized protein LOC126965014 n=1 Tax=Leptidea sinapis TaxID=189913 RepID=UPI0021C2983A|nr:uncharacterized protein LOC126965014 [Leptidea sinapis]
MPKTSKSGERMMVLKVKDFCEREKRNEAPHIPLRCVQARVAAITGISEKTVTKMTKEGKVAASTSTKLIWSVLKRRVAENNVGQEANKIVQITEEAFATITAEEWNKECEHIIKIEDQYYGDGPVIDSETERFIIEVGEDTDTSDDSDAEDNNMSDVDEHNYCKKL